MYKIILLALGIITNTVSSGYYQTNTDVYPGADERSPSRSEYFSWINNTNEGATEKQTLINLEFFKWLQDEY